MKKERETVKVAYIMSWDDYIGEGNKCIWPNVHEVVKDVKLFSKPEKFEKHVFFRLKWIHGWDKKLIDMTQWNSVSEWAEAYMMRMGMKSRWDKNDKV
jgi:hypothetical protein